VNKYHRGASPNFQTADDFDTAGEKMADELFSAKDAVTGIFYFMMLMLFPRLALCRKLASLPAAGASDVKFFMPGFLDLGLWLDDCEMSSPADIIDLMSLISAIPGSYAVHGWVPYCPWRHFTDRDHFPRVMDAVMSGGFIGVKMYPVMGYYPFGNKDGAARGDNYPLKLRRESHFGRRLDDSLNTLYGWCESNGVPVLAHCSYTMYPDQPRGCKADHPTSKTCPGVRAGPHGWKRVLEQHPGLRIDIGHIGGPWNIPDNKMPKPPGRPWTERMIELLDVRDYSYASADLSDYADILRRTSAEQQEDDDIMKVMNPMLASHDQTRHRIMYGTDWAMMARNFPSDKDYYPAMRQRAPNELGLSGQEVDGFFGANAARLVGLAAVNGIKPQTRQRLESFYRAKMKDTRVLTLWDT
jgi:predicted TIM-barrel fold metal-dependent hydrolase